MPQQMNFRIWSKRYSPGTSDRCLSESALTRWPWNARLIIMLANLTRITERTKIVKPQTHAPLLPTTFIWKELMCHTKLMKIPTLLLTMRPFFTVLQTKTGVATWHGGINLALCRRVFFLSTHPCGCHFFVKRRQRWRRPYSQTNKCKKWKKKLFVYS